MNTTYGDIKIGSISLEQLSLLLELIKKYPNTFIKEINNEYYLSVPIIIGCNMDPSDPYIYIQNIYELENFLFYFEDLHVSEHITFMSFSFEKDSFMCNQDKEGFEKDLFDNNEKILFEILPLNQDIKTILQI
jgi:hypothetical protein